MDRATAGSGVRERLAGPVRPGGGALGSGEHGPVSTTPRPPLVRSGPAGAPGPRDASMFIGGLRALLLQSLHPLAMAAVAGHSGFRGDPWGGSSGPVRSWRSPRSARPSTPRRRWTTCGACTRGSAVRPSGEPYHAAIRTCCAGCTSRRWTASARPSAVRAKPLDGAGCDGYIHDMATVAHALGVPTAARPGGAGRPDRLLRPELRATREALDAARFILLRPPLPWPARPRTRCSPPTPCPRCPWARKPLRLPRAPGVERSVYGRPAGADGGDPVGDEPAVDPYPRLTPAANLRRLSSLAGVGPYARLPPVSRP